MRKKLVAMIMASALLVSLSACDAQQTDKESLSADKVENTTETMESMSESAETESSTTEEEIPSPEAESESQPTSSEAEKESEPQGQSKEEMPPMAKVADFLDVSTRYHYDSAYGEASYMYGHYGTIELKNEEFPALTKAVDEFNKLNQNEAQNYLDRLEQWAVEEYREYGARDYRGPYVFQSDMSVRRGDTKVLSLVETCYDYAGGAHGNHYFEAMNFDVQTGEEIVLESVIKDTKQLPIILEQELLEKYPDVNYWTDDLANMLKEYVEPSSAEAAPQFEWTLDYEGVTFYFSDYAISSYADGTQQVTLTYKEYPQVFHMDYFNEAGKNYVQELSDSWRGSDVDLKGDGKTDYVSVITNYNPEYGFSESFVVEVNGNRLNYDMYSYDLQTYLVKTEDKEYLYIQRTVENDYQSVSVFEITESSVEHKGDFAGGISSITNSLNFRLHKRMDLLSTYSAIAQCYVGEDGMPVEYSDRYRVESELTLTSKVAITADLVDDNGNLKGESYTFPASTEFTLISTDGESFVDVETKDGSRCRFYAEPGWPPTVNGMEAESCFEMLYYAG